MSNYLVYLVSAGLSFLLALALSPLLALIMRHFGIVDAPKGARKIHEKKIPLGGGLAIWATVFIVAFVGSDFRLAPSLPIATLVGIFYASLAIMIGGLIDDKYNIRAWYQVMWTSLAGLIIYLIGIRPAALSSPFGGVITFDNFMFLADIITYLWLMGMMFTTKILDGLDGLVTGIAAIGALLISILTLQSRWYQPEAANLSLIFMGACLGFLVWNWHPAKIFLGQGGSLFAGFMLAILALIAGGKIATAFLVLGVPMLDMMRVAAYRVWHGQSIFHPDNEHFHFKLLHSGLSQRQAVLLLYAISFLFGMTTLFLQSRQLLVALSFLLVLMLLLGIWLSRRPSIG